VKTTPATDRPKSKPTDRNANQGCSKYFSLTSSFISNSSVSIFPKKSLILILLPLNPEKRMEEAVTEAVSRWKFSRSDNSVDVAAQTEISDQESPLDSIEM